MVTGVELHEILLEPSTLNELEDEEFGMAACATSMEHIDPEDDASAPVAEGGSAVASASAVSAPKSRNVGGVELCSSYSSSSATGSS